MSFDSVFHGAPTSVGGQSISSGRASLGIDAASGILYFRTPENAGWQECAGSRSGDTPGGATGDIQYNNAGAFGGSAATITAAGSINIPSTLTTQQLQAASVFIDASTAVLSTTSALVPAAPFLTAGTYTIKMGMSDNNGNWSNLVSYTITADGAHNYIISWQTPTQWISFSQFPSWFYDPQPPFIYAWVSFNGGPFVNLTTSATSYAGYNYWQPIVILSHGYTTNALAVPTNLNTLPIIQLTSGTEIPYNPGDGGGNNTPVPQLVGAWIQAPKMWWIYLDPLSYLGGSLTIEEPQGVGVCFISPASYGGALLFAQNGIGSGRLTFDQNGNTGSVGIDCGNAGAGFTGTMYLNVGTGSYTNGISAIGNGSLAIGNGTAGDKTGQVTAKTYTLSDFGSVPTSTSGGGTAGTVGQLVQHSGVLYFCSVTGVAGSATWNVITMTLSA